MTLRDIVRAHMHDTLTLVYASGGRALAIREDLTAKAFPVKKTRPPAGRPTLAVDADTLGNITLPASWLLVALIESRRDVEVVATWAQGRDPTRVRLFFPPGTDIHAWLHPWAARQIPLPRTAFYGPVPGFRQVLGIAINNRIGADFGQP